MLNKLAKNKQTKRVVVALLIFTLTFANWMVLGQSIATSIAASITENLEAQGVKTNQANVEFDAYFEQNGQKTHQISPCLNEEPVLTLDVEVKNSGYLKDAKIELGGIGKSYEIISAEETQISDSSITLKQVNAGELLRISAQIGLSLEDAMLLSKLNNTTAVTLTGTYVDQEGKQIAVEKTIKIQISWSDEAEVILSQDYIKYADYETEEAKGVIVQSIYKVERNEEKTSLPIEETNLLVQVPEIEGKKLITVSVNSINTSGTNGKKLEEVTFGPENWKYNEEENTLAITVKNEETNGAVWAGKGYDQYLVTFIYENETETDDDVITLNNKAVASIKEYNKDEATAASIEEEKQVSKTADIVTYQIETNMQEMSKGKLYANHITEKDTYEINYETKVIVNIPYAPANKENLNIEMVQDKFINKEEETLDKQNISYYKSTKIAKANFDEILGEEGYISVLNGEKQIARIDSGSLEDENGNYQITYTENFASLKIETSAPIAEGNLIITNEKKINNDTKFTNEQITSLAKIETSANNNTAQINLTETNSGISVEIDRTDLSSIAVNKDVTIKIILNNKDENTLLYEEPVFDVILPENIADIQINQSEILYAEGLTIANVQKGRVGDKPAIRITLAGTQEEFSSGVLTSGTNIILKADITLKELCPNTRGTVAVKYTNNNPIAAFLGANLGAAQTAINLTAPEEVISYQTIKTDAQGNEVTSVDEGKVAGKIEIFAQSQTKQMELKVLNNYTLSIGNIVILGRIPGQGKTPEGVDLGSTFDARLKTAITSSNTNATIYYSENAEATKTLDETWKTAENADLSKVKSYLIVFPDDYTLPAAGSLSFTYDFEIPANLEHSNEVYGAFTTYYNKIDGENKIAETSVADLVGLTTGEGPRLAVELSANVEDGAVVREGQRVTFTAKVTNTGKSTAENVVVQTKDIERVNITNKSVTIGDILAGETKSASFEGIIPQLPSIEEYYRQLGYTVDETGIHIVEKDTKKINGTIQDGVLSVSEEIPEGYEIEKEIEVVDESTGAVIVTITKIIKDEYITELPDIYSKLTVEVMADKLSKNIASNTTSNIIKETKIEASMSATIKENIARTGEEFSYQIPISVKDQETLSNIKVELPVLEDIEYTKAELQQIDSEGMMNVDTTVIDTIEDIKASNGKVTIPVSELHAEKAYIIKIYAKVKENIQLEEASKTVYNYANIFIGSQLDTSTEKIGTEITKDNITITQECSNQNYYIKPTEKATFTITITNKGLLKTEVKVQDIIPETLKVEKLTKLSGDKTIESYPENHIEDTITISPEESVVYKVETSAKYIEENKAGEIANIAAITVNGTQINSNTVKLYIEYVEKPENDPNNPSNPDKPDDPNEPEKDGKYKISGTAWIDENKNGQMDNSEQKLSGIEVYLINANGETIATVTTDENGQYIFKDLSKGKYIVAFKYNNETYNLTDYKKSGVSDSINSDVIGAQGTAITDNIEITDASIGNINMGVVVKEVFDLKLDKYVSKIVVQTASGTKEYNYTEETLAKVEIKAKELKGAKVMMEYQIVITNEGKTAGYAKEIVDYMPSNTVFSSELNSGWYLGSDNNLHTTQLKDVLIQPGESKTVTVVLSRTMTEQNTGTVNNRAEIEKSYNQELIEDKDSTAGNKATGEDDIGSADIIIGVATGREVIYITLGIICMIILATGTYLIKKKVLEK